MAGDTAANEPNTRLAEIQLKIAELEKEEKR